VVAPWLEEMLFTVLGYWSFVTFNSNSFSKSSKSAYVILNSVIFSLAHLHMKWDEISFIWSRPRGSGRNSLVEKFAKTARVSLGLLLVTFIYKIYTNLVMAKMENFWPCFILHSYCNLMGPPMTSY